MTKKAEKKNLNLRCPYCGGEHMTVDVVLCLSATVDKDGHLEVKDYWEPAEITEAMNEAPAKDLSGYCDDCEEYCDYVPGIGFIANEKIASESDRNALDTKVAEAKIACKEAVGGAPLIVLSFKSGDGVLEKMAAKSDGEALYWQKVYKDMGYTLVGKEKRVIKNK